MRVESGKLKSMNIPHLWPAFGFTLIALVFFYLLLNMLKKAIEKTSWPDDVKNKVNTRLWLAVVTWAIIVMVASVTGFAGRFDLFPLNAAPFLALPLVTITWVSFFSQRTKEVLLHLSPSTLLYLQVFRIPVELLLWALFAEQLLPVQMTFEGRNFDILSGMAGPVVAYFFASNRTVVIAYNFAGLALLLNIVGTALLSMPTPFRYFMEEPANTVVMEWGVSFLPTLLVPLAYGLHFLSLRQTFLKR